MPAVRRESFVCDLQTGKPRAGFATILGTLGLTAMDKGRVASQKSATELVLWDGRSGQEVGKLVVPELPPGGEMTHVRLTPSPNGAFVVSGWQTLPRPNNPAVPLRVFNVADKKAVVETEWRGGGVFFTADSSRVLVAEHSGRCRWFKLPDGTVDREWQLDGDMPQREHLVTGISADGSVMGYCGPSGVPRRSATAVLDGTTGKPIHQFPMAKYDEHTMVLSADGRRAAVLHRREGATDTRIDVADARTGAVIGTATFELGACTWELTADGSWLIVFAHQAKRVHGYELKAAPQPPVRPQAPAAEGQLKERWSVELKAPLQSGRVAFDADGQAVAVMGGGIRWTVAAVDARTGKEYLPLLNRKGNSTELIPLDKGRFGYYADSDRAVTTWTPTNGKEASAPVPGERGGREPFVRVSPNARYMLVSAGVRNPGQETPEVPLQVLDLTAGGPAIQHAWRPGRVMFTADSSRALVVDDTDRFRWFKLPGARPDGEWKFDRPPNGFNAHVVGMSAKGEVLLFEGTPTGAAMGLHLLNGKDGTVLHTFPAKRYHTSWGAVSEDGRMVALVRNDGFGVGHTVEVVTDGGDLVASVKLPAKDWAVAFSWKGRALAVYERDARRLTAYDLPEPPRP